MLKLILAQIPINRKDEKKLMTKKIIKTTDQIVKEIRVKKMSRPISALMGFLVSFLYKKPCKVTVDYHVRIKDYKNKPVIVVSNHASRFDYAFVRMALKRPLNIIAAENEFHRKKFKTVFKLGQVIPLSLIHI